MKHLTAKNRTFLERLTLEDLANRVVVEGQQVGTLDTGFFASAVIPHFLLTEHGREVAHMVQLEPCYRYFDPDCPRSFGAVAISARKVGLPMTKALSFYTKSRLRYSCMTTIYQFLDGVVPQLRDNLGITELPVSSTLKRSVALEDFEHNEIYYVPNEKHAIMHTIENNVRIIDTIEKFRYGNFACHSILVSDKTGVILDLTMGQITGTMRPAVFTTMDEYKAGFPGQILKVFKPEDDMGAHVVFEYVEESGVSLDFDKVRFGTRVIQRLLDEEFTSFCHLCLGTASDPMKCCGACKQVYYCSKVCQGMHWKMGHKKDCCQGGNSGAV
jgi:hypothetical protein